MKGIKLVDSLAPAVTRGQIFRLPARWPYEEIVDFMVVDIPDDQYGHSIAVASGNKAGLLVVRLPVESRFSGTREISREWLVENWAKWIYPDCPVEKVYLFKQAEIPSDLIDR
ncbi:Imm45 family immunity protein [Pseudomonas thivervalensis]|uniref:Imm45 family immunity protein n=1 Tax=Pseudomonas thivervalensis TaxID=86265 RepID=UPI00087DD603|nr:Imm45 family immunity protein [Pseudomonas thivervalensis]SDF95499.1 Immunity protein 45 [Pseudomonas thivervalensis]